VVKFYKTINYLFSGNILSIPNTIPIAMYFSTINVTIFVILLASPQTPLPRERGFNFPRSPGSGG
jgi:hypothetical protein